MIKTFKFEKQMNFRELMEYIFSKGEEVYGQEFKSRNGDHSIKINMAGRIFFRHREPKGTDAFNHGETYEVEAEEEITKDTEFHHALAVYYTPHDAAYNTFTFENSSINKMTTADNVKSIYVLVDGKLHLVWERD